MTGTVASSDDWKLPINFNLVLVISGICFVLTLLVSLRTCYMHVRYYSKPYIQKHIVRIVLIVPIYSLGSFLSLVMPEHFLYFDTVRDSYEAFCIYNFLSLMLNFCGGENVCSFKINRDPGEIKHPFPLCCLPIIPTDNKFMRICKQGVIQFVIIKPLMAIISLIMLSLNKYETTSYQACLIIIYNISFTWALYVLYLFYLATKTHLANFHPVKKFLAVKLVVFLTFWQYLGLQMTNASSGETELINDAILCIEMLFFSFFHAYAFPYYEFRTETLPDSSVMHNLRSVLSVRDAVQDTYHSFMPAYQDYVLANPRGSGSTTFRTKTFIVGNLNSDDHENTSPSKNIYGSQHRLPKSNDLIEIELRNRMMSHDEFDDDLDLEGENDMEIELRNVNLNSDDDDDMNKIVGISSDMYDHDHENNDMYIR